jgi:hypothetical protein
MGPVLHLDLVLQQLAEASGSKEEEKRKKVEEVRLEKR